MQNTRGGEAFFRLVRVAVILSLVGLVLNA
jgi:hypothetical protein